MEKMTELKKENVNFLTSIYREGFLDNQFMEVHEAMDPNENDCFKETINILFQVVDEYLRKMAIEFAEEEIDYAKIKKIVCQFRGTCVSIGCHRVVNSCDAFGVCYIANNIEGCMKCVKGLKDEYFLVKSRFKTLLTLEERIRAAGGTVPATEFPLYEMKRILNPKCHRVYGK